MTVRPAPIARRTGRVAAVGLAAAALCAVTVPTSPASATTAQAAPAAVIGACSPSVTLAAFSDAYDKKTLAGVPVGGLSALALDHGKLLALSDRSSLFAAPVTGPQSIDPTRATVQRLTGADGLALDSEGLAVDTDGTRLVTSETEPSINRFSPSGQFLGQLPVPPLFRVAPAGGGVPNGTFESLTLTSGGRGLVTANEAPLAGDAGVVRFLTYQRQQQGYLVPAAQYAYSVDAGLAVPEVQSVDDGHHFLVLERGYTGGVGNTIRLYLATIDPATTDVSGRATLAAGSVAHPVTKTLLADLGACPTGGATAKGPQANPLLDNIEGMVVTGRTGGRLRVLLVSDDNDSPTQTTRLYSLLVTAPAS